jgi:hypothetical protein
MAAGRLTGFTGCLKTSLNGRIFLYHTGERRDCMSQAEQQTPSRIAAVAFNFKFGVAVVLPFQPFFFDATRPL